MVLAVAAGAQESDRSKIPDRFKWNLTDIYPSDTAWRAAKDKLAADIPALRQFQGKLASSAARWPTHSTGCLRSTKSCRGCSFTPACKPTRTRATASVRACGRK